MAYARMRGKKLAIVQGLREADTQKVVQTTLFSFASRPEAEAAVSTSKEGGRSERFQALMETAWPTVTFDWETLKRQVEELATSLPDEGPSPDDMSSLGKAIDNLTKELLLADPRHFAQAAELIDSHQDTLVVLVELIDTVLDYAADRRPISDDEDPFGWGWRLRGDAVPPLAQEHLNRLLWHDDKAMAEATVSLMERVFGEYIDGRRRLGWQAVEEGEFDAAAAHFKKGGEGGRKAFPQNTPDPRYWSEHMNRAWMENTKGAAFAAMLNNDLDEAFLQCDSLESICGERREADKIRVCTLLQAKQWAECHTLARRVAVFHPAFELFSAVALLALGEKTEALELVVHVALNFPEEVRILFDVDLPPSGRNTDLDTFRCLELVLSPHLDRAGQKHRLALVLSDERISEAVHAARWQSIQAEFRAHNDQDGAASVEAFQRLTEMRSFKRARDLVRQVQETAEHDPSRSHDYPFWVPALEVELSSPAEPDGGPLPDNARALVGVVPWNFLWGAAKNLAQDHSLVDVPRPNDLDTLPSQIGVIAFKGRGTDARRWHRLLRKTHEVTLRHAPSGDVQLIVPLINAPARVLTIPARSAARNDNVLKTGPVFLLATGGGTLVKRHRISLPDILWMAPVTVVQGDQRGKVEPIPTTTHYEIEVSLDTVWPKVWRRFLIRADRSFQDLHDAIQDACGWTDSHLFSFDRSAAISDPICTVDIEREPHQLPAQRVALKDYLEQHDQCSYLYDFGDSWRHTVVVTARHHLADGPKRRFLGGERAFPPEDAGGITGYEECCHVVYGVVPSPEDAHEYEMRRNWLPRGWHPDRLDTGALAERFNRR